MSLRQAERVALKVAAVGSVPELAPLAAIRTPALAAMPKPEAAAATAGAGAGNGAGENPVEADAVAPGAEEATAWPDADSESAFLAEAKERGEPVKATSAAAEAAEDNDPKALPKLEDLVGRLSPEIRDTLEDLFRAKFVRVQKVPKRALKAPPA